MTQKDFMIYIASDHGGFELKKALLEHLKSQKQEVEDCGAFKFDSEDDYPDFIYPCAKKVAENSGSCGFVIGRSGQGEAIVANKVKGVRAAIYQGGNLKIVKLARQKNNANILSLAGDLVSLDEAKQAINEFLETGFEGGRHQRRIDKIKKIEEESFNDKN